MNLSYTTYLTTGIIAGAVITGIIIAFILLALSKKLSKSKQAELAKEFKRNKELEYLTLNVKQINKNLQIQETEIAKKLDSFDIEQEQLDNYILAKKAERKSLSKKDKNKAIKVKF